MREVVKLGIPTCLLVVLGISGEGAFFCLRNWNNQSRRVIEKCGFQYLKNTCHTKRYETVENCLEYILYHPDIRKT